MSLTVQRQGGGESVTLPAVVTSLLVKTYPHASSEIRAVASNDPTCHAIAPLDVVLLGQSVVDGPMVVQTELRTSTHIWSPSKAPASAADHVVFCGQPLHGAQLPYQMTAPTDEATAEEQRRADFDKKQAQLKEALASNKRAYADAKQTGEVMEVGALAIERDRIEQELAIPFVPRVVSRAVDQLLIAPLTIELPFGLFKHPETSLLFTLISKKERDLKEADFKQTAPVMFVNGQLS